MNARGFSPGGKKAGSSERGENEATIGCEGKRSAPPSAAFRVES